MSDQRTLPGLKDLQDGVEELAACHGFLAPPDPKI
jgi:hypothetical protein